MMEDFNVTVSYLSGKEVKTTMGKYRTGAGPLARFWVVEGIFDNGFTHHCIDMRSVIEVHLNAPKIFLVPNNHVEQQLNMDVEMFEQEMSKQTMMMKGQADNTGVNYT